ncbi:hemolysin-type calcium-binding repeat protein (plasmid) [Dinoroseobacter shibae DFL 12 = DSM 16493]|jgi:Ca2+-binding RTX toxin-like protein|uniref:Hemolysin-type calcium-binding repeat protein n=1 Tax=Dinoroseobacter shibae (strain DSM 16493 / NCIMB 14021 / DFL 12) TaxID=398580 RepID=A8LTN2_DINSH|nr:RTX toxins and related Ca2+-binding protein-like protein [Dinoroseobacter shibae]ABV95599.1 hemolysin-type calcium-binding repeat protein [Dinoroseobacter shibae DFL 12 = DSM 16493]
MAQFSEITADHFGMIYTGNMPNRVSLENFIEITNYTGIESIRWPGGTLSEIGFRNAGDENYYDLTADNLLENQSGTGAIPAGLSEILSVAVEEDLGVSIIIPTLCYTDPIKNGMMESPNLDLAFQEYYDFLEKLLVEKAWGKVPANFTLEIGNEASLHFGENQDKYGQIANTFLAAYDKILGDYAMDDPVDIAIQMGISQNQSMNQIVIAQIDDDFSHHIDAVRNHELNKNHGLSWDKGWAGLNDASKQYFDEWLEKTGKDERSLDHYVSAWNTGTPTVRDQDGNVKEPDPIADDYGMKELSAVVEMFANFSLLGVDKASHWGVAVSEAHPNETSSVNRDGSLNYTPKAEVIRLVHESLIGTTLSHDITKDADGNQIRAGYFRSDIDGENDPTPYRVFLFEDDSKYVMFIAANRFEMAETDVEMEVEIILSDYIGDPDVIGFAWSEQITVDDPVFNFSDTLDETSVLATRHSIQHWDEGFTVNLSQNYELVRVIASKQSPGKGNLHLWGSDAGDALQGGGGSDTLEGNAGTDMLFGANGGDILRGGAGDDTLLGEAGDDDLQGGDGADILHDGDGRDDLRGGTGADLFVLAADGLEDVIWDFNPEEDQLDLSAWTTLRATSQITFEATSTGARLLHGNEVLILHSSGGTSLDRTFLPSIWLLNSREVPLPDTVPAVFEQAGAPMPRAFQANAVHGNDHYNITGNGTDENVRAGAGRNLLVDGAGADRMVGSAGADIFVLVADGALDEIVGFNPDEDRLDLSGWEMLRSTMQLSIAAIEDGARITYRDETLVLRSVDGAPLDPGVLAGLDMLELSRVPILPTVLQESFQGSSLEELLEGNAGVNILRGRAGNDRLMGHGGDDWIEGGIGADTLEGGADDDLLFGNAGHDTLLGQSGNDFLEGNAGNDLIRGGSGHDWLTGGQGNDHLLGEIGDDILWGLGGSDTLEGGDGADQLEGGDANDWLFGDAGNDTLNGGVGFDWLDGGDGNDILTGLEGFDSLFGGAGDDSLSGNAGNDLIEGGAGDDTLQGGQGIDVLRGGAGNDLIRGQTGFDELFGGAGNDTLQGGEGNDRLAGEAGNDVLTGGIGADVFVFDAGTDVITDFSLMVDRLALDGAALGIAGLDGATVLERFSQRDAEGVQLRFETGDGLDLEGVFNLTRLADLIDIF